MLVSNKINLKRLMFTVLLPFYVVVVNAQNNTMSTHAGPKGIWILCGNQLPKDFTYRVFRQKNKEGWIKQTDISFPKNKEELQAEMMSAQGLSGLNNGPMSETRLKLNWERLTDPVVLNSPIEMQDNYPLRQANGTAWFDAAADSAASYTYKVQLIGKKDEVISESISKQASTPGKSPEADIAPLGIKSVNGSIIGEFNIAKKGGMNACKVFRSYYLRKGFEEIPGEPIFLIRDSVLILQFTDKTAVEKVPYTYVIQPIDPAGNVGAFSQEMSVFNVADNTIVPSVVNFRTSSAEKEKAIRLSWKLKDTTDVVSIDIFKGDYYDGDYVKIASVAPADTAYLDHYANPVETYYYTIRLNGNYEKSPTSPRVSGMLKASRDNYFPPQHLRIMQNKNVINLAWERNEDDTRAYYVYRSIAGTQQMQQIGSIIITDSATVFYTDTLPTNARPGLYAYAVADQNTSYAISDLSKPVFANIQGAAPLPIPHGLKVLNAAKGSLQVIWPDMLLESPFISGYKLYRRANSIDGTIIEPVKPMNEALLDPQTNIYTDTTARPGMIYYYSLRTVSGDEATMSSPSLEAGITIQPTVVNGIANVRVFLSGKTVAVKWNNPIGDDLKSVRVIRSTDASEETEEIAGLSATAESFTDTKVTAGVTYYYQLQIENKQGKKSRMTDAVGIKIYKE